ncbi:hypothetical protein N7499_003157 [Penicillium canescens]|uniref:Uncharacterized protein n=1 Tax=Penicillium canescens TaxID=5083 RepID=A0AAD6IC95_PENCN|nr:uncharacterized protein N7446_012023 [Penicillium canescens]KAJ6019753.1 hypothetical protein N7522_000461 [Penicillium canescens]KAJ6039041.1 hypothetical protein N7460_007073 [Penicillium canescens]KAJ6047189.1 hypothetical protein N7446_012023 [Penicillium canescens]KAJ6060064.1 hypothetical protein N7444_002810 [Penicillium canescens]KAJ6093826.1 hypothetical protein N7499_003157 [Penicillium canescens]
MLGDSELLALQRFIDFLCRARTLSHQPTESYRPRSPVTPILCHSNPFTPESSTQRLDVEDEAAQRQRACREDFRTSEIYPNHQDQRRYMAYVEDAEGENSWAHYELEGRPPLSQALANSTAINRKLVERDHTDAWKFGIAPGISSTSDQSQGSSLTTDPNPQVEFITDGIEDSGQANSLSRGTTSPFNQTPTSSLATDLGSHAEEASVINFSEDDINSASDGGYSSPRHTLENRRENSIPSSENSFRSGFAQCPILLPIDQLASPATLPLDTPLSKGPTALLSLAQVDISGLLLQKHDTGYFVTTESGFGIKAIKENILQTLEGQSLGPCEIEISHPLYDALQKCREDPDYFLRQVGISHQASAKGAVARIFEKSFQITRTAQLMPLYERLTLYALYNLVVKKGYHDGEQFRFGQLARLVQDIKSELSDDDSLEDGKLRNTIQRLVLEGKELSRIIRRHFNNNPGYLMALPVSLTANK